MWIAEQAALHRLTGHWFTVMSERSLPVTGLRSWHYTSERYSSCIRAAASFRSEGAGLSRRSFSRAHYYAF